ncbi:MAG: hypothetical protein LQ340_002831 [Diploschistes diacapsis]|nr:MAG: hypothetical protein LQ340_002831 [Diploschistes diacapsis]
MPRTEYHPSEYSPQPRRRGGTQVAEFEEIDIRERRRGNPEPDFMREDYGRNSHAGALVVREDIQETKGRGPARSRHGDEREYRDEEVIIARSGNRDRERDRDRDRPLNGTEVVEEEEIRYHRGERRERRPRERETVEEEVVFKPRRVPYEREVVKEEWMYRPKEEQPMVAKEVEEWTFAPRRREPSHEREHITIRERERERPPPQQEYRNESITIRERERERPREYHEEDITIRERERERPRGDYREEDITIRERERERPRGDYREEDITIRERERERPRGRHDEEITIRERERERPPPRDDRLEEITIRERERERPPPPREDRFEEIRIRERERERPRSEYHEEDITIKERSRDPPRRGEYRDESITVRERSRTRGGGYMDDDISIHERDRRETRDEQITFRDAKSRRGSIDSVTTQRTRGRGGDYKEEELIIRRDEHNGPRGRNDELVIRRKERSPSASSMTTMAPPEPPREPEPIRAPPIHQEIITHHRHIDHGFETYRPPHSAPAPKSRPPSPPAPPSPPKSVYDEIEIHRKGKRNGQRYDDDIVINRRRSSPARIHRSPSPDARTTVSRRPERGPERAPLPAPQDESDFYARKTAERAYIGEGYNGATRDWAIVDVPPGTNRVKMDGVGGASEEITWQRYNGVRRSRFIPEPERERERERERESLRERPERERETVIEKRKYVGMRPKTETMWTEITKDLVIKEAIEGLGYDYEETEYFFYVMEYLRYPPSRPHPPDRMGAEAPGAGAAQPGSHDRREAVGRGAREDRRARVVRSAEAGEAALAAAATAGAEGGGEG